MMATDQIATDRDRCVVQLKHADSWLRLMVSFQGPYSRGSIVDTSRGFANGIAGQGEASTYTHAQWLSGVTSGALYAFRTLDIPRQRLLVSQLDGVLNA